MHAKESPSVQGVTREKMKTSITDFFGIDDEARFHAECQFSNALYGKFLGRAPSLDVVKTTLLDKWKDWGEVSIANLPNGYFLIQCST